MLSKLRIKNIALIPELELDFCQGLNVLSGETGAGKSIIVDSLNFILGAKADKTLLRYGEKKAVVEAIFYVSEQVKNNIIEADFDVFDDDDNLLILSRTLEYTGKSECRINGRTATGAMLKRITDHIVDIHGQHEHQSLLKPQNHLSILDCFVEQGIMRDILPRLAEQLNCLKSLNKELSKLGGNEYERSRLLDILSFQIDEIEKAGLNEREEEELLAKRARIINLEKIVSATSGAAACFNDENGGVLSGVGTAIRFLSTGARYDQTLSELASRLEETYRELQDISEGIGDLASALDFDSRDADEVESRLDTYVLLKKKYGGTVEAVNSFFDKASQEFEDLTNSQEKIEKLTKEKEKLLKVLFSDCEKLSHARRQAAKALAQSVLAELADLNMKNCEFEAVFSEAPAFDDAEKSITQRGFDRVEFFLSANCGEPLKPLAKIISGGEMSRLMLALKVISSQVDQIETMIFDEIDSGISGKVGQTIAMKLARIAANRQVLCVTHLPQIAAMADRHFFISKQTESQKTITTVTELKDNEIIDEIARLAGGKDISASAFAQAEDIKNWSNNYKSSI